jgi:hypothetical protein
MPRERNRLPKQSVSRPLEIAGSNPADPIHFDVVRERFSALNAYAICPHMIQWGKASEFVEKKFRRSKSVHTKRYYEAGIRRFRQYCEEKQINEVDEESVYRVLTSVSDGADLYWCLYGSCPSTPQP